MSFRPQIFALFTSLFLLSPQVASASASGTCELTAVVVSEPIEAAYKVIFEAVVTSEPSGYCHLKKRETVEVTLEHRECKSFFANNNNRFVDTAPQCTENVTCTEFNEALGDIAKGDVLALKAECMDGMGPLGVVTSCGNWEPNLPLPYAGGDDEISSRRLDTAEVEQLVAQAVPLSEPSYDKFDITIDTVESNADEAYQTSLIRMLERELPDVGRSVEQYFRRKEFTPGTLGLQLTISLDGQVIETSVSSSDFADELNSSVTWDARTWWFARPNDGPVEVTVEWKVSAKDDE